MLELTLEEASLHDMISDTISSFQPQAEQKGVRLLGEISGDVDPVLANPPKLQRVLHNLVSNALRHTPQDGTVTLRAAPEGDVTRVEVSDTGEGIAAEDLPRVFERSFRGEQSRTRPDEGRRSGRRAGARDCQGPRRSSRGHDERPERAGPRLALPLHAETRLIAGRFQTRPYKLRANP